MSRKKKAILTIGLTVMLGSSAHVSATNYVWDAGGTTNLYTTAANWDPTSGTGGPGYGDTGVVGGSYTAAVSTAATLQRGQTLIFSNSATLFRNTNSGANYAGILTFADSSKMIASQIRLYSNAVFNWHSSGTWNGNGANAQANLLVQLADGNAGSGPVINMSAGTWNLTGNTGANSLQLDVGTFNMTGGKIFCEDLFKLGTGTTSSRFNLGGPSELWLNSGVGIFSDSIWNFNGSSWAVYAPTNMNLQNYINGKLATSNIYNNGSAATNISFLIFSTVNIGGTNYTKVNASAPEPQLRLMLIH